jgi:hypothetical protein
MTNEHAETLRHLLMRYVTPGPPVVGDLAMALAALEALAAENKRLKAQRDLMVEDWHDEQRGLAADRRALAIRVLAEAVKRAGSHEAAENIRNIDLEPLLTPEGT